MEVAHAPVVSRERLGLKAVVIQLQQQRQPTQRRLSHQIKPRATATTIHRNLKTISQQVHQAQPDIHPSVPQLVLVLQVQLVVVNPIQELKHLQLAHRIQALKLRQLAHHIQHLVKPNVPQVQPLARHNDQPQSEPNQDSVLPHNKDPQLEASDQEFKQVVAAAVDLLHRASKMKAKKAITQPFPVNQTLIIRSILKSQKHRSTVTSRSSQATTPTLKRVAKFSIFALWTKHSISFAPTEQSSPKKT